MKRLRLLHLRIPLGLALVVALVGCGDSTGEAGPADLPPIIIISLDTTRADHMGFYGNPWIRTPNLDRLAAESIIFEDASPAAPSTLASHTSLFTGKYAHTHGTPENGHTVNGENVMLAEVLRAAGYRTAGFIGAFPLGARFGFAQGFETYDENFDLIPGRGIVPGANEGVVNAQRRAGAVADSVIGWIDGGLGGGPGAGPGKGGQPQFLFIHFFDSHRPYMPPKPYSEMYRAPGPGAQEPAAGELDAREPKAGDARVRIRITSPRPDFPERMLFSPEQSLRNTELYAGEVTYLDAQLGRILDRLETEGLFQNAIVAVVSDHGERFWEHWPHFNHGMKTYQETVHVIGMIRLPGGRGGGARVGVPVSLVDFMPTILNAVGLPIPEGVEGRVLDLEAPETISGDVSVFSQATKPHDTDWQKIETDPRWLNMNKTRMIRRGPYKFIQTPFRGTEELYHLPDDPFERTNLIESDGGVDDDRIQAIANQMRTELEAWADSAAPLQSGFATDDVDDTVKKLKSLGYLQ